MRNALIVFLIIFSLQAVVMGQIAHSESMYRVFDGQGNVASLDDIVAAMANTDVVFLGELHDDAVGHAVQAELFRRAVAKYFPGRRVALSLEMFERDVQMVVDEYLAGLITEQHFLSSSRPWGNYKTDYRPLVELAREKRLAVLAANAPRRYVNMVSRGGRETLAGLSDEAREFIAPLPYPDASQAYAKKFLDLMKDSPDPQGRNPRIINSQALWDATMAHSIAKYLSRNKRALVIHLNGGFHTENRLGTVEQLANYRRKARSIVVTIRYEDDFTKFDRTKHALLGDFVILTDAKQPRSKR